MGIVYLIKNSITGLSYVGKTVYSLRKRWVKHCYDAEKRGLQTKLARAIRKYPRESFELSILEETEDLLEREKFWICEMNTYRNGYNLTLGGEGLAGLKHTKETRAKISLARKGKAFSEAHKKNLRLAHMGQKPWNFRKFGPENPLFGRKRPKEVGEKISQAKWRKVVQISLGGEEIEIFNSLQEAAASIGCSSPNISKVCRGNRKKAGGFRWKYLETEENKCIDY